MKNPLEKVNDVDNYETFILESKVNSWEILKEQIAISG